MTFLILGLAAAALLGFWLCVRTVAVTLQIGSLATAALLRGWIRCIAHRELVLTCSYSCLFSMNTQKSISVKPVKAEAEGYRFQHPEGWNDEAVWRNEKLRQSTSQVKPCVGRLFIFASQNEEIASLAGPVHCNCICLLG